MGNIESPKSLYQIIEQLKDDMVTKFPDQKDQIIAHANDLAKTVSQFLDKNRGLDEICAFFDQNEKIHSEKIGQEIQNEIRVLRYVIKDQIIKGNIVMPNLKNGQSALPEKEKERTEA